jgi:hypothetical protein
MASPGLLRVERCGLVLLGILALAFGGLVELRSCFQATRKTDFEVYARAAWAVRSGADIYQVTCSNRYHYTYPPAFAVLLQPLADAPQGEPREGLIPFGASVALWTALNYLLVGRMAHVLAGLVLPHERRFSRRWWYARTVPVYLAFGGIGYSIGFGQVNVLLLAMMVEMLRAGEQGQRFRSGLWLAACITLKVFPAYLVLHPLARRDGRALAGVACGLILGLGVVPVLGLGFSKTASAYERYIANVLMPGALGTGSGVKELIDLPSNDSQSFLAVIHGNLHPDRATQPGAAAASTRLAHNMISGFLTVATLLLIARRTADPMIALGLLMLLMLHITPMSHMHYYCFGYVLAGGLWLKGMRGRAGVFPGWRVALPLVLWGVATLLPLFPGALFETLRHRGLGVAASMTLWIAGSLSLAGPRGLSPGTLNMGTAMRLSHRLRFRRAFRDR